jgi:hypothetical protein
VVDDEAGRGPETGRSQPRLGRGQQLRGGLLRQRADPLGYLSPLASDGRGFGAAVPV